MGGKKMFFTKKGQDKTSLIFRVSVVSEFTIPTDASESYAYDIDWGDGNTASAVGDASHTYAIAGEYIIKITGVFPKFYFNNGSQKSYMREVISWGTMSYSSNQKGAFHGVTSSFSVPEDSLWFNDIINGESMFNNCSLSSIPNGVTFNALSNGKNMFTSTEITTLPVGTTFSNLVNADNMFQSSLIETLPYGVTFQSVTTAQLMFLSSKIKTIPNTVTFASLINGYALFQSAFDLVSISDSITFNNTTNGQQMFRFCSLLTTLPDSVKFSNLTNGINMLQGVSINTMRYSQLLNDLKDFNTKNNVSFSGGLSKYNTYGKSARDILITAPRNWTIIDEGLE